MRRLLLILLIATTVSARPRAREIGVAPGILPPGPLNAITDVAGVRVGHTSVIRGENVRTGVTVVLPHGGNLFREKVPGAVFVGNGFGKLMGSTQIEELGEIESPIALTSTLNVPRVADALIDWMLALPGNEDVRSINVVVGETNDGQLNDIRGRHVGRDEVFAALKSASSGAVEEGSVGAGVGTIAFGWKGGIGTSSRKLPAKLGGWTVGVLVQTNYGGILTIDGVPVGRKLGQYYLKNELENADGSIMIIIATDAPVDARNLKRMGARAMLGLARTGAAATNGSGDYAIAFSTNRGGPLLKNDDLSPLFLATIEATEEAIYNSLFKATDVGKVKALPLDFLENVQAPVPKPPPSKVDNVREVMHGVEIMDPYRWLEDQDHPETRAWIDAQNKYTHSLLDELPSRPLIQKRLSELLRVDSVGMPFERSGRYFLSRKRAEDDLSILYVRQGLNGKDEVLIDPHTLSTDHTTDIGLLDASNDGKLMVYSVRRGGADETELHVMDVDKRKDVDQLPHALYRGVSMKNDGSGFYYNLQRRDTGIRVFYHAIGTDPSKDVEVFGKGYGPDKWIGASISEDGRYLLFEVSHGWTRNEVYVQKLPDGPIQPIVNDIHAHFNAWFAGDRLVMQTDWQAPNQRIVVVDLNHPARERWREIIPEGRDAIGGFSLVGGKLFVSYLHDVTSRIRIFDLNGKALGEVSLPGPGSASGLSGRWASSEAFFSFRSFVTPQTIYRYDVPTGKTELWAQPKVPFKSEDFEVRQVWYSSKDGTKVPMFLVHKKGLQPDGKLPVLLYGYGGFDVSQTPRFSSSAAIWAEQGGVYALANIRGGGEFGEAWHKAGMLDKKQNVFDDFIAAAEWLIKNKYTNPSRLAIQGGSNGGLLVGAALTQRPELYQAVLCQFPDLDMIGYYRFKNNNPPALLEYGNASDPAQFKYLYAYSPYQKVKPGEKYPAVLFTTGDQDTRVPPLQARKMTARLQAASTSGKPVLLLYDTKAGHAGGRPMSKIIEDLSLELAFLFWQLGMKQVTPP